MDIRLQGYENQVRLFLVLLVLFLVAVGIVSLNALHRTQALLTEEAEGRITASARAAQRELDLRSEGESSRAPQSGDMLSHRLREVARAYGITSLEVTEATGKVVASSDPWRLGVVDPFAAETARRDSGRLANGGAVLREAAPMAAGSDDDQEYGPDRAEVTVFLALSPQSPDPQAARLLMAGFEVLGLRTVTRQIRLLAFTQAAAGLMMLVLVLLFVRWVLRPYRALKAAASGLSGQVAPPADLTTDDPEDLVTSFRGVIGKMREQEVELERMRSLAERGGPGFLRGELLEGLTSGVMIVEASGLIVALNPAGEQILGIPRRDLLDRDYRKVFSGETELLEILSDGVERGRAHAREVVPFAGGGRTLSAPAHLGVTVSALPSVQGVGKEGGGAFCLFSDLTEIRGLQERVRVKESLAALGAMSAGIAHEFRNSLATILGYARLIGMEHRDPRGAGSAAPTAHGTDAEHAGAIVKEVRSIGRIVDDFLRFSRPAELVMSEWDPRKAVEEVAREVALAMNRPDVTITVEGEWPERLVADEALVRQALANLVRNAVEAIPGGAGLVSIKGGIEAGGRLLRIEVEDSGTGIPPEILERLFTPFVTSKPEGTGLGLALAQKAVVSHDGAIDAGNRSPSGGATFTVRLPLDRQETNRQI